MHLILDLLLGGFDLNDMTTYIVVASLAGIVALLAITYLLFFLFTLLFSPKPSQDFEYTLIRKNVWAWLYVFNCVWLSAEIIACWHYSWLTTLRQYIPLWIVLFFSAVMAIIMAYPFKKRASELKQMAAALQKS